MGAINVMGPGFYHGHFYICMYNLFRAASDSTVIKAAWAGLHKYCPCDTFRSAVLMLHTRGGRGRRVTFRASVEQIVLMAVRARALQVMILRSKTERYLVANTAVTCLRLPAL